MKPNREQAEKLIVQWKFSAELGPTPSASAKSAWQRIRSYWMKFAHLLGKLNSYLFLTLFYWILIGPAALVLKLLGKDLLDRSPKKKHSYWVDKQRDPQTLERSKRQF